MSAHGIAASAKDLIGTPFRLHGHDPATGLDCVGLVGAALAGAGHSVALPAGYRLRNRDIGPLLRFATYADLRATFLPLQAGDIVLFALPGAQHHLAIADEDAQIIHAHAGLRRVVRSPIDPEWRTIQCWRHRTSCKD